MVVEDRAKTSVRAFLPQVCSIKAALEANHVHGRQVKDFHHLRNKRPGRKRGQSQHKSLGRSYDVFLTKKWVSF